MSDIDHERSKDLVAAYVLGALPLSEIASVRAHILSCEECMEVADAFDRTASVLSLGVEDVPPPAGFTARIMEAAVPEPEDQAPASSGVARLRRRSRWSLVALAAAVAGLVAFGAMTATWLGTNSDLDRTERALTAVLHGGGDAFALTGAGGAVARVVPMFDGAFLVAAGLQEAPSNHVYQLWLIRDGEPVSAGLFDGSDAVSILETNADLDRFDGAAVTVEPEGGSARPTTAPVLASDAV